MLKKTISVVVVGLSAFLWQFTAQAEDTAEGASAASIFGRELYNKVKRGVVYIGIMGASDGAMGALQFQGSGSGFIFQGIPEENAAYALTNHHVAGDCAVLQVELWDGNTFKAELIATEPGLDVSLIKLVDIDPSQYEVNVLGNSDLVQPGDTALAIGAPGNRDRMIVDRTTLSGGTLNMTATMRTVTGVNTDPMELLAWWTGWQSDLGREVLTNLPTRFVTQTTINPGNSGGPLYNSQGEVIGLNHAHFGAGPLVVQNTNYTIPINYAKTFAYQIINNGTYDLPWMGLDMLGPPTFTSRQQVEEFTERWYDPAVLKVYGVRAGSPAEAAGFEKDDIIVEFDSKTFPTYSDLRRYVFDLPVGQKVPVRVRRGRVKVDLEVEIGPKRRYNSEFSL